MSLPMMAFAPPRLSMTSGWPSTFSTSFAMTRAFASVAPPGGNGTTRRIGRVGQVCPEPAEGVCAAPSVGSTAATDAITGSKQDSRYLTLIGIPYVMPGIEAEGDVTLPLSVPERGPCHGVLPGDTTRRPAMYGSAQT